MHSAETRPVPATEVRPKPKRRVFTAEYKAKILAEAAAASKAPGAVGALLRREGLYSSHLASWRQQARRGTLKALGRKRGPKQKRSPEADELARLQRENERLRKKLDHAEKVIDVQKKLSEILGVTLDPPSEPASDNDS